MYRSIDRCLVAPARSGSTWACELLNNLEGVVALDEPYSRESVADLNIAGFLDLIEQTFRDERQRLLDCGQAYSTKALGNSALANHYGEVDPNTGLRARQVEFGLISFDKPLPADFTLIAKHTIPFTGIIDQLIERYPTYVLLRNPLSIIASWNSIDASYREGRIQPYAQALTGDLHDRLASPDRLDRQISLLEWHFEKYRLVPTDRIIRYEQVAASRLNPLAAVAGTISMTQSKSRKTPRPEELDELHQRLLRLPDASPILAFYDRESIDRMYGLMTSKDLSPA